MNRPYRNREEAGIALASAVARHVTGPRVVAGIPRGGAAVAAPIAERLQAPLTLAFARKLTLPLAPELAVGALDEGGHVLLDRETLEALQAEASDLSAARTRVRAEIERQRLRYGARPLAQLAAGASVVLVDDGLATGLTMRAAVAYARRCGAREVVVAVPCASTSAAQKLEREADRFVCPWVDPGFLAVGAYYLEFGQVSDEEVVALLERASGWIPAPAP